MKRYTKRAIELALSLTEGSELEMFLGIVCLASSVLKAIRVIWVGLGTVGHAYRPLTFMVGHCNKTRGI